MSEAAIKLVQPRAARKPAVKRAATVKDNLTSYANAGVVLMALLSAMLNGYANAQHATIAWAGWGMGLIVPVIILILGKVASLLYKRGRNVRLAKITGGVGIGLLALSVWHCASSISLLTGTPLLMAVPMAVAIDCGFVACELAALRD